MYIIYVGNGLFNRQTFRTDIRILMYPYMYNVYNIKLLV